MKPGGNRTDQLSEEVLEVIEQAVRSVTQGSITLVVQDGRVILVEKNEKIRLC